MSVTWTKSWSTATNFANNTGHYKPKHERAARSTVFEFLNVVQNSESLITHLQKKKILPTTTETGENLTLVQLQGKNADRLNENFKFRVDKSKPSK